jgi:hypothetical protein
MLDVRIVEQKSKRALENNAPKVSEQRRENSRKSADNIPVVVQRSASSRKRAGSAL